MSNFPQYLEWWVIVVSQVDIMKVSPLPYQAYTIVMILTSVLLLTLLQLSGQQHNWGYVLISPLSIPPLGKMLFFSMMKVEKFSSDNHLNCWWNGTKPSISSYPTSSRIFASSNWRRTLAVWSVTFSFQGNYESTPTHFVLQFLANHQG